MTSLGTSTGCSNSAERDPLRMNVIQSSHDIKEEVTACPVDVKEEIPETLRDVKQEVTVKQEKDLENSPVSFSIPMKQLLRVNDEFSSSDATEGDIGDKKHLNTIPSGMNSTSSFSSAKLTRIRSFLKPKSEPGVFSTLSLSSSWVKPSKTEWSENSSSGKEICTLLPSLLSSSNDPARDGSSEKSNSEPVPRFADFMKDQLSELIAHQESLTGEMSFKCTTCEKCFPDQFTYIKHKFREHRQIHKAGSCQATELQCKSAPNEKLFTRLGSLSFNKHLLPKPNFSSSNVDNSAQKMFACRVCAECFPDRSGLTKHLLTHTDLEEESYSCTECNKSFQRKSSLLKHARVHTEENLEKLETGDSPFQCFECGKWFTRRLEFDIHYRIHMNSKPYKCFICKKGFLTRGEMKKHKWIHVKEKPYKCTKCGKSFLFRDTFVNHKRRHSGEKPAACNICGKSFVAVKSLLNHLKIHTGKASYSCSICGKSFLFRSYLLQHRKVHGGVKPFKCTECGKNFRAKCALKSHEKSHERVHSGEITPAVKYFICTDCGKSFTSYCRLLVHKKIHAGGIKGAEKSTSG